MANYNLDNIVSGDKWMTDALTGQVIGVSSSGRDWQFAPSTNNPMTTVQSIVIAGTPAILTNPTLQATNSVNNYTQISIQNKSATANASADLIAYPDNVTSSDLTGFMDMGITSSAYAQAAYAVTGQNEGYLFMSAPSGAGKSGDMIIATDSTGTSNNISFAVNGFGALTKKVMTIFGATRRVSINSSVAAPTDNGVDTLQVTGTASVVANSATAALTVTQTGAGHAFVIEDEASDTTPFVVGATGNVGIGSSTLTQFNFRVSNNIDGNVSSYGIRHDGVIRSGVTAAAYYYSTNAATQAAAFTLNELRHYSAGQSTIGAGSSVTNQYGFVADSALIGATNNYGFLGSIPAGTGRWNLYMAGTAINYLAGNLLIGSSSDTGEKLQVNGNVSLSTAGNGFRVKEGPNAKQGVATLVAGTVVVANTSVTANSRIFLTSQADGGTPGFLRVSTRTASTSFTILSSSGTDTSTVAYEIFEPTT